MDDEGYSPSNRQKVRTPKPGKFWCWGCDGHEVSELEKCPRCGRLNKGVDRLKKDTNA